MIPVVNAREMVTVLLKAGFKIIRQKGSHNRFHHPITGRSTTVAMHVGDLTKKIIKNTLGQAGLSVQDFLRFLK